MGEKPHNHTEADTSALHERSTDSEAAEGRRERAERGARVAARQWQATFDAIRDPVCLLEAGGRIIRSNQALADFLGMERSAIEGRPCWDVVRGEPGPVEGSPYREALQTLERETAVWELDGRWVKATFDPMLDEDGYLVGFVHILEDITERTQAERALRLSQEQFSKAFHSGPLLMTISAVDDGTYFEVNENFVRVSGYGRESAVGTTSVDLGLISAEDRERLRQRLLSQGRVDGMELSLTRESGETFSCLYFGELITIAGEERLLSIAEDITERKKAQEAVRRRAEELNALQATVLDITARHDLPVLLEAVVERATELLDGLGGGMYLCDPGQEEVRCVVSYNTPDDYTRKTLGYGEGAAGIVAQTGAPLIIDDYRTWDGRAATFEEDEPFTAVLSAPMVWEGEVTGVIHVLHDVETRRFSQADLELLTLFADHAAIAVENARLLDEARREIAERERTEGELRRREHEMSLIANNAPALVSYVDADGTYRFVNKRYEEWFDLSASEMVGKHHREVLGEDTYQAIKGRVETVLSGRRVRYEEALPYASGGTRWVLAEYVPDVDEEGRVAGFFALVTDISERKEAEEALQESEERFRQIAENIREVFYVYEPLADVFLYVSPGYEDLWLEPVQAVYDDPLSFTKAVHPDDRGRFFESVRREREEGCYFDLEYRIVRPDGSVKWVWSRNFPILDEEGSEHRVVGIAEDITDRKEIEESLRAEMKRVRRVNELFLDREHRVLDLKREVNALLNELDRPPRYDSPGQAEIPASECGS